MTEISFDFIGITETVTALNSAKLLNYKHFDCCTRSSRARIYNSDNYDNMPRPDLYIYKPKEIESVVQEVVYDKNFIVACIYKHPLADSENFLNLYSDLLDKILAENKKAIFFGDFNLDLLNAETNTHVDNFLNCNLSHCMLPTITRPTRITRSKDVLRNV